MVPRTLLLLALMMIFNAGQRAFSQVEVQGAGVTGATKAFVVTNANPDTAMVILDNGRVGIGTTTPTKKFEVNGVIYTSSGGYMFPDGSIMFSAPTGYAKVYTVALAGGDFTSIQMAINACAGASKTNPYLVMVMPGVYNEPNINCKKFVDLRGSGKHSCVITGTVNGEDSCLIENFKIRQGIYCNGKSPFILHNMIMRTDSAFACGIKVTNAGHPWIKENDILDCNGYGIICEGFGCDAWIIANNILRNQGGGIQCQHSSPTISNNFIDYNYKYGIYVTGQSGTPSEPTIDDNVIGHTMSTGGGHSIGVSISLHAEPRLIANDIYVNDVGIEIDPPAQPSIIGNNINYNNYAGIVTYSAGLNKNVVIMGNHIHSNTGTGNPFLFTSAGISVMNGDPMITQNNVSQNRTNPQGSYADIDYSGCAGVFPMISLNVYDYINRSGVGTAGGLYNVTSAGVAINP